MQITAPYFAPMTVCTKCSNLLGYDVSDATLAKMQRHCPAVVLRDTRLK